MPFLFWQKVMGYDSDPDVNKARYRVNSRLVPLMYFLVGVNTWSFALSAMDTVPYYLSIVVPVFLTAGFFGRGLLWWFMGRHKPSDAQVSSMLMKTNVVSALFGAGITIWAGIVLYHGDETAGSYFAFFICSMAITGIFCLMHMRFAAAVLTVIANVALVSAAVLTQETFIVIAAMNIFMITLAMLGVMFVNYRDFQNLILSRKALLDNRKELLFRQQETQSLSDQNMRLANLDSLTSLENRRSFFRHLENTLKGEKPFAIGLLDLNGFKKINDLYGHNIGDMLLVETAKRLRSTAPEKTIIARLGGDEFAMLFPEPLNEAGLESLKEAFYKIACQPFLLNSFKLEVTFSMGFANGAPDFDQSEMLYEKADYALYQAKADNECNTILFGERHAEEVRKINLIEKGFLAEGFAEQIEVVYQPIINTRTAEVAGFESLARWTHPEIGAVRPDVFVEIAERCNFINMLTQILFQKALEGTADWSSDIYLSFNLSAKNIASVECVDKLIGQINNFGFDPKRVHFEITETAMILNPDLVSRNIETLKSHGIKISLDDFGTGFSTLKHLHILPLDTIKIDRSFVAGISASVTSHGIVKSLLSLSRDMGIGCVVEGVETEEDLQIIRGLGGGLVQGYYYARPMPVEQVKDYLASCAQKSA